MAHEGDCFLVPGPVRMSDACLQAMATPVMTARGTEFRDVMADLNAGLRTAFNLTPSSRERGSESWTGEDGYKVIAVSGSGTAAMWQWYRARFLNKNTGLPMKSQFARMLCAKEKEFERSI